MVGLCYWVVRVTTLGSALVLAGTAMDLALAWREGLERKGVRRLLWCSWAVLLVSVVLGVLLQGLHEFSLPLGWMANEELLRFVLRTRFGEAAIATAVLLAIAGVVLDRVSRSERWEAELPKWWLCVGLASGAGVLVPTALSGHAASGRWRVLGTLVSVLHLASAAVWIAGLCLLGLVLLRQPDATAVTPAVVRISNLAFWAVAVVVASGVVQSAREVGGLGPITGTTFGRMLLAKSLLVAVLVALGALSRRLVHGRLGLPRTAVCSPAGGSVALTDSSSRVGLRALRWSVVAELAIALSVLGVTAALVDSFPPEQAAPSHAPVGRAALCDTSATGPRACRVEPSRVAWTGGADARADERAAHERAVGRAAPLREIDA